MPEPELKGEDVFHVIGFTSRDILGGAHLRFMKRLDAPADPAPRGLVVRKLIEVYFLDAPVSSDDVFEQRYGDKYDTVNFYNEAAFTLSNEYRIQLPPVIGKITRAELPKGFGTSIRRECFTG
jgi:hypothetical protein